MTRGTLLVPTIFDVRGSDVISRLLDSPVQLVILVLLVVVVFGWKRLPDAARSLGRSARILKSEVDEMGKENRASNQTVKGETAGTNGSTGATPADETRVPGEAPTTPPADQPQQRATNDTTGN